MPSPTCPQQHPLFPITTDFPGYKCDACGGLQAVGTTMWECNGCDYDLCLVCYSPTDAFGALMKTRKAKPKDGATDTKVKENEQTVSSKRKKTKGAEEEGNGQEKVTKPTAKRKPKPIDISSDSEAPKELQRRKSDRKKPSLAPIEVVDDTPEFSVMSATETKIVIRRTKSSDLHPFFRKKPADQAKPSSPVANGKGTRKAKGVRLQRASNGVPRVVPNGVLFPSAVLSPIGKWSRSGARRTRKVQQMKRNKRNLRSFH